MKKIIKKTFSLALAVCMLCSLNVFASADETVTVTLATSEAQLVAHNTSTSTLSNVNATAVSKMDSAATGNVSSYKLTDAASGHTKTSSVQRLYLRFDLSGYKNWDISSASLAMNVKNTNTGASSTIAIYDAATVSGSLSDIPTTYSSNISTLTAIASDSNMEDSFTIRGNGTPDYVTSTGLRISRDFTTAVSEAIAAEEDTLTLLVEFHGGADNTAYIAYVAAAGTDYAPTLSVTGTPKTSFSVSDAETLSGTNPVVYNYTNNVQVEVTEDMSILNNSANGYYRVFVTFDLTSIDKAEIEKATFKNAGYRSGGVQSLKITKVATPFNPADKTYVLDETSAVESTAFGWQTWETVTADLTTMIKNCEGNSLTVCIENTSGSGGLRFTVTSDDHQNPAIDLVYASETATELATLAAGTTVTAERFVQIGSAAAPQSAVPIIALYEDGELSGIKIGEAISLDGTGQTVSVSINAAENLSNPKATFFLWTSLQELVPLMESSSIE